MFKSYLSNRTQCVSFNGLMSDFRNIICGVPQGSILGPVLFLVYINDVYRCSDILTFILFADDTTIFLAGKDWLQVSSVLENELIKVSNWFKANKLSFNIAKTNLIAYRKPREAQVNISISLDGVAIKQVETTKFLGVEIDQFLCWKSHINKIENKISAVIGILSKIRYKINKTIALMLYKALVLPHLSYCNIVWGNNYKTNLNKLSILQKRALKISTLSHRRTASCLLFSKCSVLNLFDINKHQVAKFMYLLKYNLLPMSICELFQKISNVHQHYTRSSHSYWHSHEMSRARCFSVFITGPKIWDSLPVDIKNILLLHRFSKSIKNFFIESYIV